MNKITVHKFLKEVGLKYKSKLFRDRNPSFEKRKGKVLRRLYFKYKDYFVLSPAIKDARLTTTSCKELILLHPDCPKELKIAEEL